MFHFIILKRRTADYRIALLLQSFLLTVGNSVGIRGPNDRFTIAQKQQK